jgi:hypothetical protein
LVVALGLKPRAAWTDHARVRDWQEVEKSKGLFISGRKMVDLIKFRAEKNLRRFSPVSPYEETVLSNFDKTDSSSFRRFRIRSLQYSL